MKAEIILIVVKMLLKFLSPELVIKLFGYVKDRIETAVQESDTKIDDFIWNLITGSVDELKIVADTILDFCEDYVLGTASNIDDALVLPICKTIRDALDIPDND